MGVQSFMATMAVLFAVLVWTGRVEWWHAYVYVFIGGTCWSVTLPLQQVLVANTVPQAAIVNAYATNVLTITGTRILGPLIGGILIATFGFSWNFALEGMFYAGTVLAMLPMKTPYAQRTATTQSASLLSNFAEGINYIWRKDRVIFHLIILGLIPNMILHPVWFLLPVARRPSPCWASGWSGPWSPSPNWTESCWQTVRAPSPVWPRRSPRRPGPRTR